MEDRFRFDCHPGLDCFTRCCREAVIVLSPYDLLRLSRALGLTTGEFLRRHTRRQDEAGTLMPLVLMKPARTGGCPFLGAEGCTVYEDRPAACRLFPVVQGSELAPEGAVERHFLRRLDYCRGFAGEKEWTLKTWQAAQGFPEFDRPRRPWLAFLARQAQPGLIPPDDRILSQVYMVAYDLDGFRTFVFQSAFLASRGLTPTDAEPLKTDDLALLRVSAAYLERLLFPEKAAPLGEVLRRVLAETHADKAS
jgi:Fe-S-cluster containining protein